MVMMPLVWMVLSSLKSPEQGNKMPPEWLPMRAEKATINGKEYFIYEMPVDGTTKKLALLKKIGANGNLCQSGQPSRNNMTLRMTEGERVMEFHASWDNYTKAMTMVPFGRYLFNTLIVVVFGTLGTVVSCIMVAYGFSRFRAKGLKGIFLVVLGTIMLPAQVTLIPTFIIFKTIGWYDTLLPLIVPAFLRQCLGYLPFPPVLHELAAGAG